MHNPLGLESLRPVFPPRAGEGQHDGHFGTHEVGGATFGFGDFLDIINPIQHIPLLGALYRDLTGDEIAPPARIIGGTLFGGPLGFLVSLARSVVEEAAGADLGALALAALTGDSEREEETPRKATLPTAAAAAPAATQAVPPGPPLEDTFAERRLRGLSQYRRMSQARKEQAGAL
jgi:hypothetical protein